MAVAFVVSAIMLRSIAMMRTAFIVAFFIDGGPCCEWRGEFKFKFKNPTLSFILNFIPSLKLDDTFRRIYTSSSYSYSTNM